jgi:RNA polymerase sigma-70 factor (ECF subfamily)
MGRLSDRARFQAEAMPHRRELYGTACRLVGPGDKAESLVHDTFVRAYKLFAGYEPGTGVRLWLYQVLHQVRADMFRRDARAALIEGPVVFESSTPKPQALLEQDDEAVWLAVAQVPEPYRTAVVLRDVQDLAYGEIAAVTLVPEATVMSRIHRGRSVLRRLLEDMRP